MAKLAESCCTSLGAELINFDALSPIHIDLCLTNYYMYSTIDFVIVLGRQGKRFATKIGALIVLALESEACVDNYHS